MNIEVLQIVLVLVAAAAIFIMIPILFWLMVARRSSSRLVITLADWFLQKKSDPKDTDLKTEALYTMDEEIKSKKNIPPFEQALEKHHREVPLSHEDFEDVHEANREKGLRG
ncbi:hypothetical protein MASR2M15_24390 [Anaerolineales bacterium]